MNAEMPGQSFLLPRLKEALWRAGSTHEWNDVLERLLSGRAQWWASRDQRGAIITEILKYPNYSVVNYWLAAGKLASCMSLVPEIERWAVEDEGCVFAIGLGRPGFGRILGPEVVQYGVAYRKRLTRPEVGR